MLKKGGFWKVEKSWKKSWKKVGKKLGKNWEQVGNMLGTSWKNFWQNLKKVGKKLAKSWTYLFEKNRVLIIHERIIMKHYWKKRKKKIGTTWVWTHDLMHASPPCFHWAMLSWRLFVQKSKIWWCKEIMKFSFFTTRCQHFEGKVLNLY